MASQLREWFARNVHERRKDLGLTQTEFAAILGVSQPVVSDLENDRTAPSLDVVAKVAKALSTTGEALLSDPAKKISKKIARAS